MELEAMMGASVGEGQAPCEPTLVLQVGYDGTDYSGFAAQANQGHVRTVAGELTHALGILLRREATITCAGRTDAGVHARRQYVSVALEPGEAESLVAPRLFRSLNSILPEDIRVHEVLRAAPGFSARFDALARTYVYRIVDGPCRPLFCDRWAWWTKDELDLDAMARGAAYLVGEHDFKSFCKAASAVGKPTRRFVEGIGFERVGELGEEVIQMTITGNAFLHSMVRTITGTLWEVGRGHRDPEWVSRVLAACDRNAAGSTAPACGLTFMDVRYPEGALVPWE